MLAPFVLLLVASLALFPHARPAALDEPNSPVFTDPPGPAGDPLAEAEHARQNGDVDTALGIYRSLLQNSDAAIAEEARARMAGLDLARGDFAEAASLMQPLVQSEDRALRDRASFVLAEIARAKKDCVAAIPLYQSLVSGEALLAPYAGMGLIHCAQSAGDPSSVAQHAQDILNNEPHRRLRIETLEKLATAEIQRGNTARALQIQDELFKLGATRTYRGTVLFNAAELARSAGYRDLAVAKLSMLVQEYPEHQRALAALDTLNRLQESGSITWTQAALVRLKAGQDTAARTGFDTALAESPDGPEAATARYNRATLILGQGRETEAAGEMRIAAEAQPDSAIAPVALLRAGRIIESNGRLEEAREIYQRLTVMYPNTTQGQNGRFRLGLLQYLWGDRSGAAATWQPLTLASMERDLQTLALQWQGKALREMGDDSEGTARLQRALDLGPDTFAGFRARAILEGDAGAQHTFHVLSATRRWSSDDDPELDDWLTSQGSSKADLQAALEGNVMYRRAAELSRLGLREQATWELDGLAERASQEATALPHQFALAAAAMSLGYPSSALGVAESAARAQQLVRTSLPAAFQRLLMPMAFQGSLVAGSNRHGADPLLLAAVVRQESRFDPSARSSARALGLSQIVPATGQTIARALGYPSLSENDLLKPSVNLDLGAYYLSQQLKRYDGSIMPALAAYNAGGVPVDGWLREFGRSDMDLFAARVPYAETSQYLHVVYENYGMYKRLYGAE
jgi:peptidoglycan lytic transglycosylase